MWLFLYTEIMLFGGLFVLYAVYYTEYTADFIKAGNHLMLYMGLLNTLILLTSSFLVAAALAAVQRKSYRLAAGMTVGSILLGILFLANKYFEWSHEIEHGFYPGSSTLLFRVNFCILHE